MKTIRYFRQMVRLSDFRQSDSQIKESAIKIFLIDNVENSAD